MANLSEKRSEKSEKDGPPIGHGAPPPPTTLTLTTVEILFNELADRWKRETGGLSSLSQITANKNYLRIIALGWDVVPFILNDLKKEAAPWFAALRAITNREDIGADHRGDFRKIADAWIAWGVDAGYIECR